MFVLFTTGTEGVDPQVFFFVKFLKTSNGAKFAFKRLNSVLTKCIIMSTKIYYVFLKNCGSQLRGGGGSCPIRKKFTFRFFWKASMDIYIFSIEYLVIRGKILRVDLNWIPMGPVGY